LSKLEPTVACHPDPGQRKKAKEWAHQARPRLRRLLHRRQDERFRGVRRVLRGKKVTIDTFGVPATPEIVRDLQTTYWGNQTASGTCS
jgi:3-isopropylmalate/(R)-2-methylmalate dehydratase large subunit